MNYAGLIFDDSPHYLDHLGPFCALLNWPLILCEDAIADLAKSFYPGLQVIVKDPFDLKLPSHTVSCYPPTFLHAAFPRQRTKSFWLPHGNSDKGWKSPFFEALSNQDETFVYGQKMIDFMHAKNVFPKTIRVGNFRWEYFLKHRNFYQTLTLPLGETNFLYAPTWDDSENNCSFWQAFPYLAKNLPETCNLLIKLHPNTIQKYEVEIEILKGRFHRPNIHFLPPFPPIYPLLNHCHAYIGDMSSIGYDFLKFDRPLYFLNANRDLPLHRCGSPIDPSTFDFKIEDDHSQQRKELYQYTFEDNALRWLYNWN